jgi:hypothetical protein
LKNQSTTSTAHHPKTNGTTKQTPHKTWKLFPSLEFLFNKKIAPKREEPFKIDEILGSMIYRLKFPETLRDESCSNSEYVIKFNVSDHPSSQHVSPKDQIHPHSQNLLDFC